MPNIRKQKQKLKRQYVAECKANKALAELRKPVKSGVDNRSALVNRSRQSVKVQSRPCRTPTSTNIWERIEYTDKGVFLSIHGKEATLVNGTEAGLHHSGFVYLTRWTICVGE